MAEEQAIDELLSRLLAPRIGQDQASWPRRVHAFVERAAAGSGKSRVGLLEQMLSGGASTLLDALINSATIGHTAFFRHPLHFEHLRGLLPKLALSRSRAIDVWCAGCSTGEEAYSVALCAQEVGVPARILATDVNPVAVQTAREGRYVASPRMKVPGGGSEWTAPASLKRMLRFEEASLTGPQPTLGAGPFDLIFCRNVLIYFERSTVPEMLGRLAARLGVGGTIVVSPADAVLPLPPNLKRGTPPGWLELCPVDTHRRRSHASGRPRAQAPRPVVLVDDAAAAAEPPMERAARLLGSGRQDDAEQILMGLLNQDPHDVVAWFLLGEILLQRGERVQARLAFQKASSTPRDIENADAQAVAWAAKLRVQSLDQPRG